MRTGRGRIRARLIMALALLCRPAGAGPDAGRPAAGGRRGRRDAPADHPVERIHRPHPGDRPRQPRRARHRLLDEGCSPKAPRSRRATCSTGWSRGPFEADVAGQEAAVAQFKAQLHNANIDARPRPGAAEARRPASSRRSMTRSPRSDALAAQILGAEAQLRAGADQSRLHRDPCADRRQDRPHRHHRRQRRRRRHRHRWRRSSARTRCMWCSRSPTAHRIELQQRYADRAA